MATDDRARQRLYTRLIEQIDDDPATTLMELLPTVPHTDTATKADLAALEERLHTYIELSIGKLGSDLLAQIDRRFAVHTRIFVLSLIASNATLVGMVVTLS